MILCLQYPTYIKTGYRQTHNDNFRQAGDWQIIDRIAKCDKIAQMCERKKSNAETVGIIYLIFLNY